MKVRNAILSSLLAATVAVPAAVQAARVIEYEVEVAPPPPRVEVVPAPREGYTWEPGYWQHDGRQYVWVDGRVVESRPGHRYIPHTWEHRGEHWFFRGGHWDDD